MFPKGRLLAAAAFSIFAAVRSHAQIFWQNQSPAGLSDDITSVAYGNGEFAAVTAQGNVLTSPDGLAWSASAASAGTSLQSITYGNGSWVASGANGAILVSADLKTWIIPQSGTSNSLNGVGYVPASVGGYFIAVGDGGTIFTSPDAIKWTPQPSGVTENLYGVATAVTGPDAYALICGQGGLLLSGTENGEAFSRTQSSVYQDLEAVQAYTQSYEMEGTSNQETTTVAVGANGTIESHSIPQGSLLVGNEFFDVVSQTGMTATLRGLAVGGGYFVAVGDQGTVLYSLDGFSWNQAFAGDSYSTVSTAALSGIAYAADQQRFVAVGAGGTIVLSYTLQTYLSNVSTRGSASSAQPLIGGFVVAGNYPRTVLVRADGPVLATFNVPSPLPDPVLTIYDSSRSVIATNTGWTTSANPASISALAQQVGAFALPSPGKDSALLLNLPPGAYTAIITSAGGNSGTALFEAYLSETY
jgi:photosystem II stability/assembly factor-like uncharacterized protein